MISALKQRIATSETYLLFKSEGLQRAILHLWVLLRHHWRALLFIRVGGYIAEADLGDFKYSESYHQNIRAQKMEFHLLRKGETLPDFCHGIAPHEIESRLAAHHRCYVLKHEGNVVCTAWVGFGRINYGGNSVYLYSDHSTFTLESERAWFYDSMCDPRHRKKGFTTGLNNETLRHLKNSGIIFVVATVGLDNIGNIKAMLRTGFRLKEKVLFRRYLLFKTRKRKILSESDNDDLKLCYHI